MTQLSDIEIDIQTKLLRATFLNNMAVLKKYMPEIYDFFVNYKPSRAKLTFDQNGEVNIVSEGSLIYAENAKRVSREQADLFFKSPRLFSYQLAKYDETMFQHEKELFKLYYRREKEVNDIHFNLLESGEQIDTISIIGMGLGYYIERLFELCDIRYLYVFEPDPDVFYCALHTIDIGPLIEKCFSLGGSLTFKVGGNANQFTNELNRILEVIGPYNVCRLFMYRHYHSDTTDDTFQKIHEMAYRLSSGWGFYEDEVISAAHTLSNVDAGFPIIMDKSKFENELSDKPVFIIGNGPSLDDSIEYIKANKNNAIIFSCGTALCPLLRQGVTPDFHIEMERTKMVYDWIVPIGDVEKLKEINIIALNTVHTDALKLFKQAYLMPKPKDVGMDFLYQFIDCETHPSVVCCNPTVTNAATAAAVHLGFNHLYLFGVDYGYKDVKNHHAKGSLYYNEDFLGYTEEMKGDFKVKGNFGEDVFTTQVFDQSKAVLEILLEKFPNVECFNCSDGAFIQLTKPTKIADINSFVIIKNKKDIVEKLLGKSFDANYLQSINFMNEFKLQLPNVSVILENMIAITSQVITSRKHLAQVFTEQYKYLKSFEGKRETEFYFRFIRGTLNYFQTSIMTNAYLYQEQTQQLEYIRWAINLFHEHLVWLHNHMLDNYDRLSDL